MKRIKAILYRRTQAKIIIIIIICFEGYSVKCILLRVFLGLNSLAFQGMTTVFQNQTTEHHSSNGQKRKRTKK